MKKALLLPFLAVLSGCASTEEFVQGSKMLGGLLWDSAGTARTECGFVSGYGNVCYTVNERDYSLTEEERAAIREQAIAEQLEKRRQAEITPTI